MIFEENVNYYKKMKVPVRAIKNIRRESINPQKGMNFGLFKQFLKRAGRILLILAFLSAQVYLVSAFEAHVVNVTARICDSSETRTMGFWKNHYNAYKNCLPQWLGDEENMTRATQVQYSQYFVAFLDILGFKNLVLNQQHEKINTYHSEVVENKTNIHNIDKLLKEIRDIVRDNSKHKHRRRNK